MDYTPIPTITSLSGGKSSGYMAIHWPTDYTLFSVVLTDDPAMAPKDPGVLREVQQRIPGFVGTAELELTLLNVLRLEQEMGREVTWVCAYEGQSRPTFISDDGWMPKPLTFDRPIKRRAALPHKNARWCTEELKVLAIYWHTYLNIFQTPDDMAFMHIGYRADERHRWDKLRQCKANIIEHPVRCPIGAKDKRNKHRKRLHEWRIPYCPMVEAEVTQRDVIAFWQKKGWQWPTVSNCAHCFFHSNRELSHNYDLYPAHLEWAMAKEHERGATWDKRGSLRDRLAYRQDEVFDTKEFACLCTD
jgi:hypothetical protein